jgi:8-oxo-dGTP diphosphatase
MKQAVVALIIKDGKILSISRRKDPDKFGLIGGKVDAGETIEQALYREVCEEAGIIVNEVCLVYQTMALKEYPDGEDFYCYCYYVMDWSGKLTASDEGRLEWLTTEEITGSKAAFGEYNRNTLNAFKELFPSVELIGELQ